MCWSRRAGAHTPRSPSVFAWSGFRWYWAFTQRRWLPDNSRWNTRLLAHRSHVCQSTNRTNNIPICMFSGIFYCNKWEVLQQDETKIWDVQMNLTATILKRNEGTRSLTHSRITNYQTTCSSSRCGSFQCRPSVSSYTATPSFQNDLRPGSWRASLPLKPKKRQIIKRGWAGVIKMPFFCHFFKEQQI